MRNEKINATVIFEMMGRPQEHLKETMEKFVETFSQEKGLILSKKTVHNPKKIENKDAQGNLIAKEGDELFSMFAELDIEVEGIINLLFIAFKYLPSHIEIVSPESFNLDNIDFNSIINEILAKLHNYDTIAKSALMNNQVLASKIKEIMNNMPKKQEKTQQIPLQISYGSKDEKEKPKAKKSRKKK